MLRWWLGEASHAAKVADADEKPPDVFSDTKCHG